MPFSLALMLGSPVPFETELMSAGFPVSSATEFAGFPFFDLDLFFLFAAVLGCASLLACANEKVSSEIFSES